MLVSLSLLFWPRHIIGISNLTQLATFAPFPIDGGVCEEVDGKRTIRPHEGPFPGSSAQSANGEMESFAPSLIGNPGGIYG